jgi:hypothetical protein
MAKAILLLGLAACDMGELDPNRVDPEAAPDIAVGISVAHETTGLRGRSSESVDQPPPPTPQERRRMRLEDWYETLPPKSQGAVAAVCRYNQDHPCGDIMPKRHGAERVDPRPDLLAVVGDDTKTNSYCKELMPAPICDTPLVVAFEGEAIQFANHWPTASTPWLALDRDGDGAITSRAELFGDATVLPGGGVATNGFEALAPLDTNGDGVVDARDPAFGSILLWADRDGDRRSTPSELRPAYEVILALPLANERRPRCTEEGDCEGERSAMSWRAADGSARTGAVIDVYLPRYQGRAPTDAPN